MRRPQLMGLAIAGFLVAGGAGFVAGGYWMWVRQLELAIESDLHTRVSILGKMSHGKDNEATGFVHGLLDGTLISMHVLSDSRLRMSESTVRALRKLEEMRRAAGYRSKDENVERVAREILSSGVRTDGEKEREKMGSREYGPGSPGSSQPQ